VAAEAHVTSIRPGLPRLIATDLDGTIVGTDDAVSERTHAAFARAKAAGITVVGVTGRGPRLLDLCRRDAPFADYFVLAQGARVVDLTGPDSSTLFADVLDGALVASVLRRIEASTGPLSVMVERLDATDQFLLGDFNAAWRFSSMVRACGRAEALSGPIIKAFAHSERYDADDLLELATGLVGPDVVEMTQAGLGYIEICPRGVTKATGLAVVADHVGVAAHEVLVFGDMPNDLSMFAYAGWRRVAVANAHPSLRAMADEVTLHCDEDGVAVFLESMLGAGQRVAA
jgi:Cof subfamily protein (haloacid dehalogenase superfamily)